MIDAEVRAGRWADSARLMAAAREAEGRSGVEQIGCFMGTPANLEEARRLGLWHDALEGAGPDDLVIVASGPEPGEAIAA